MDIQSFRRNVFLPLSKRLKYPGKSYTVVLDDLNSLATDPDPDGAEALAQWVAEWRYKAVKKTAAKRGDSADFEFERSPEWTGEKPDARQQAYLDVVLEENAKKVATSKPGERNDTLFLAALKCASFVAGAGMDEQVVVERLQLAAMDCGVSDDDGERAVLATIRSAFRVGKNNPRAVPPPDDDDPPLAADYRAGADLSKDFQADAEAPSVGGDYPANPYPPFTVEDFRQLAMEIKLDKRTESRVRQVVADAESATRSGTGGTTTRGVLPAWTAGKRPARRIKTWTAARWPVVELPATCCCTQLSTG